MNKYFIMSEGDTFLLLLSAFLLFGSIYAYIQNIRAKSSSKKLKKMLSEEEEKYKKIISEAFKVEEIAPQIYQFVFYDNEKFNFKCENFKKVKKNKTVRLEQGEIILSLLVSWPPLAYKAVKETLVHWHVTIPQEKICLRDKTIICTMYEGEETINQYLEEVEIIKIEERLLKAKRKKELEKIVKKKIQEGYYD